MILVGGIAAKRYRRIVAGVAKLVDAQDLKS
jgi:hypothetical protein